MFDCKLVFHIFKIFRRWDSIEIMLWQTLEQNVLISFWCELAVRINIERACYEVIFWVIQKPEIKIISLSSQKKNFF